MERALWQLRHEQCPPSEWSLTVPPLELAPQPSSEHVAYAFADDLAIAVFHLSDIFPCLSLLDSFAVASGLTINRTKLISSQLAR